MFRQFSETFLLCCSWCVYHNLHIFSRVKRFKRIYYFIMLPLFWVEVTSGVRCVSEFGLNVCFFFLLLFNNLARNVQTYSFVVSIWFLTFFLLHERLKRMDSVLQFFFWLLRCFHRFICPCMYSNSIENMLCTLWHSDRERECSTAIEIVYTMRNVYATHIIHTLTVCYKIRCIVLARPLDPFKSSRSRVCYYSICIYTYTHIYQATCRL